MSAVGSLSWAERTGGRLANREALAFLLTGMRTQVASMPSRVAHMLGIRKPLFFDPGKPKPRLPGGASPCSRRGAARRADGRRGT